MSPVFDFCQEYYLFLDLIIFNNNNEPRKSIVFMRIDQVIINYTYFINMLPLCR